MINLTERQRVFLGEIWGHIRSFGKFPTYSELLKRLDLKSKQSIVDFLAILEREGYITRREGINLTPKALQYLVDEEVRSLGLDFVPNYNVVAPVGEAHQAIGETNTGSPLQLEYQDKVILPSAGSSPVSTAAVEETFQKILEELGWLPDVSGFNRVEVNITSCSIGEVSMSYTGIAEGDSKITNTDTNTNVELFKETFKGTQLSLDDLLGIGSLFGKED